MKQNKKKIALAAVLVLLIALLGAAGTWAYFTREARATNVITTGTVEMDLHEMQQVEGADGTLTEAPYPDEPIGNVMPGLSVSKIPYIVNTGTQPFWTRAKFTVTITAADGKTVLANTVNGIDMVTVDVDGGAWTEGEDGWYYYNVPLEPGENGQGDQATFFTKATFAPEMGNEYQGCTIVIDVQAQAVQYKNNTAGGDVMSVQGWPAEPQE